MARTRKRIPQGQLDLIYEKTYDELVDLKTNSKLVPGGKYQITDFVIKHRIPNTSIIFENDIIEPLTITALNTNTFGEEATSTLHPEDIIRYDFENNLCEDGTTSRKGFIVYRKDTIKNIEADGYDWRYCKFRRWKVIELAREEITTATSTTLTSTLTFSILTSSWLGATPRVYNVNIGAITHDAGQLTLTLIKGAVTRTKPLLKSDNTDIFTENELANTKGQIVYDGSRDSFVYMTMNTFGEDLVDKYAAISSSDFNIGYTQRYIVDENDFQDLITFPNASTNFDNIHIGKYITSGNLPNNVFLGSYLKFFTIDDNSRDNTFTGTVYDCSLGKNFYNNIVHSDLHWVQSGNETFSNYIQGVGFMGTRIQNMFFGSEFYSNSVFIGTFGAGNFGVNGCHQNQFYLKGNTFNFTNTIEASLIYLSGSDGGTGRTGFTAHGYLRASLLGYFDATNTTLIDNLTFDSLYTKPVKEAKLPATVVDELNINTLQTPSGNIKILGIDDNKNIVESTITNSSITGTQNYISKFKNDIGIEPSNIFDNGTNIGFYTNSPIYPVHILKQTGHIQFVVETEEDNKAATNNALTDVSGVSIASFAENYPETGISRWAGRSGLYINTGKPNKTLNLWIGSRAILNALPTGETAIGNSDPEAWLHVQGDLKVDTILTGTGDIAIIDSNNVLKRATVESLIPESISIVKAYQDTQVTLTGITKASLLNIDEGSLSFTTEDMAIGSRYKGEVIIDSTWTAGNDYTLFLNLGGQEVSIPVSTANAGTDLQGILKFKLYFRGGIDSARTFTFKGVYSSISDTGTSIDIAIPNTELTLDATTAKVFDILWQGDNASNEATLIDFELVRQ